uniref:Uncharacterized protein n=1 Tax=Fagus sylvatica TaxID=28930 RepID=A0A2N9GLM9_FAGSY
MERSSSTVSTILLHSLSGYLEMSGLAMVHCRHRVPSFGSTFADGSWGLLSHCIFSNSGALNLGGTVMLGNQDMLEKFVFPKEFKPCMSLIFSSKLSILLSNWESFPSGFGGVGGLGGVALVLM